ncbi:hypothetical protein DL95DRAFT_122802 [Leptodontidium sp. 2 PMI_412]|nr:hypothetical protein DL95DRAFT_122802 [Leptodontidium sp. 2 PMI_412]
MSVFSLSVCFESIFEGFVFTLFLIVCACVRACVSESVGGCDLGDNCTLIN